jgi:uncharacterized protein (TIGR02001 family)
MSAGRRRLLAVASVCGCAFAAVLPAVPARGQNDSDWYAHVTLANDRWSHGVSVLRSGPSVEAGFDYQHRSGLYVGAAVANVDYATEQVNLSLGYRWDSPEWIINGGVARYLYPGLIRSYDYTEWSIGAVYRDRYLASVRYAPEILALWGPSLDFELGIAWPLGNEFELGGTLGQFRSRDFFGVDYTHWNLGVSKSLRRFAIDLRYHDNSSTRVSPLGDPAGDRWVLSLSYAISR